MTQPFFGFVQFVAQMIQVVTAHVSELDPLHSDQLGSTLLTTDITGAVVSGNEPRYDAWGNQRVPDVSALPTDITFTGQKSDSTGLVFMNARYYDSSVGTFISPDTLCLIPKTPVR